MIVQAPLLWSFYSVFEYIATLAALLGHSKLVMVQRYVHPGESHRIEAVESSKSSMRCAEEAEKRQAQEEWAHKWAQCQKSRKF